MSQSKYLDRCFATFFSRCPKKYEWETVTQNVEEFTSRYLGDSNVGDFMAVGRGRRLRGRELHHNNVRFRSHVGSF